jgi:hypothetical protein
VARSQQVGANLFATSQEIADGLFVFGGDMNGRQCASAVEHGELAGIPTIGFDAIAGPPWNQRRGDDVTRDAARRQKSLELETAGARFITTLHAALDGEARDKPSDRREITIERMDRGRAMAGRQDGGHDGARVLIEGDDGCRLEHDRPPLYAALRCALAGTA